MVPDPVLSSLLAFAVGQLSLSLVFAFGQPCRQFVQTLADAWFTEENEEQQRRKRQSRLETFSKFLPWWILANDATVFLFIAVDAGSYLEQSSGGPLGYGLVVLAFGLVLRFIFAYGTEQSTIRDTILIFLSVTVTMCLAPSYLQPVAMLTRLILLEIVPEPQWFWRMQVSSVPANVAVCWLKASTNASAMDFMQILAAESVGSLSVVMAHCKSDWAFSQQMLREITAEKCAEEANSLSLAVRQLLSVTCDACASLSTNFHVSKPSSSLLGVLKVNEEQILNKSFIDFVLVDDRQRFQSIVDFSSTTPSSGLIHLVDNDQRSFKAKVFLVQLGSMGHFIGISKEGQEDTSGSDQDMNFLLGHPKFADIECSSELHSACPSCPHLTRQLRDIQELEKIRLVIDPLSVDLGFTVKSAAFEFAELPAEKQQRLPNFMEWLDPRWHNEIQNWVQEEVNLTFNGSPSQRSRQLEGVELLTPGGTMVGDFCIRCGPVQYKPQALEGGEDWQFQAEIHIQHLKYVLHSVENPFQRQGS